MSVNLADEKVQNALRKVDRRIRASEVKDLDEVLRTPAGRRLYCRIVYELCNIEGVPFNFDIKDGVCLAMHNAYYAGTQGVGHVLAQEAVQHCGELWAKMLDERLAKLRADAVERDEAVKQSEEKPNE